MKKKKPEIEKKEKINVIDKLKSNLKKISFEELKDSKDFTVYEDLISTGSVMLDIYLDGGFRPGVSRFIGEPEHGKTANALQWAKNWLSTIENSCVFYINSEGRLSNDLIKKSGIDVNSGNFFVWTSNIYEDIADAISTLIYDNSEKVRYFFVIDSLDAIVTKDDFDKAMADSKTVAGGARVGSFFLKKTSIRIGSRGHHLMALHQTRMNMNSRHVGQTSVKASGGKAVEFYSSLTGKIMPHFRGKDGTLIYENRSDPRSRVIGHYFTVQFQKTPHERTHETIRVPIKYNHGVWHEQECLDLCRGLQYLNKAGTWYEFTDDMVELIKKKGKELQPKFHGEQKVIDYFESNSKITWMILDYLKEICISDKTNISKETKKEEDDSEIPSS